MDQNTRNISSDDKTMEENDGRKTKEYFDNLPIKRIPQPPKPKDAITIAVSLRTLFNMTKDRQVYEDQGQEKYVQYQLEHEKQPFLPGVAFPLVKALMNVNSVLRELFPESKELFDIVLMTKKPTQAGVRLVNSIYHYGLPIERIGLSGSESFMGYLKAYKTDLYLSSDSQKVKEAIREGIAAATMFSCDCDNDLSDTQLRIAFDGDGVLFSDELEIIMRTQGLDTVFEHEKRFENKPLAQGPLKGFLEALGRIQKKFYVKDHRLRCPIRTYLVTARSAASSGARVLKTLRSWGLKVDEALFLAGAPKGPVLQEIKPHIFFDDQVFHIEGAHKVGVITAHVPYGIGQKNI